MREFSTGATRNSDDNKYVYNGFNSAFVEESFAKYMHEHRFQADGKVRAADNWKKGIPIEAYHASLHRHYIDLWKMLESGERWVVDSDGKSVDIIHVLNAIRFNVNGMLYHLLTSDDPNASAEPDRNPQNEDYDDKQGGRG